jgi:hypothetical protein
LGSLGATMIVTSFIGLFGKGFKAIS